MTPPLAPTPLAKIAFGENRLLAKIAFEAFTGGAVFATDMGTDVIAVPIAHVGGAVIGALAGTIGAFAAAHADRSCVSS